MLLAALFVRLGFWQLSRLKERRARNAQTSAQLAQPAVPVESLRDSASFRRAFVVGVPEYNRDVIYAGRSHDGSPGVYVITPVVFRPDSATELSKANRAVAMLVIRGWVYSPDAATIDLTRWRENRVGFSGWVNAFPRTSAGPPPKDRTVRALNQLALQGLFPYKIAPMYLVAGDSAGANAPLRLPGPALDDGPHLSYAIQWFSFAAIALAGAVVVARRAHSEGAVRT